MTLGELFEQLQYGELSDFKLHTNKKASFKDPIDTQYYPQLVNHINLGLMDLYTKFSILEKEVVVIQKDEQTMYPLRVGADYILDSPSEKFLGDIIRINSISTSDGVCVKLNDSVYEDSIFVVGYDTIQVPRPVEGESLFILYRASHPKLVWKGDDVLNQNIELPPAFVEALLTYVLVRMLQSSDGEGKMALAIKAEQRYNMLLQKLEQVNVLNNVNMPTNLNLNRRGFV